MSCIKQTQNNNLLSILCDVTETNSFASIKQKQEMSSSNQTDVTRDGANEMSERSSSYYKSAASIQSLSIFYATTCKLSNITCI
jgi:hypothetical protein